MITALMITTKRRWWCQYLSVEQWLNQEGRERDDELIIVSEDPLVVDAVAACPQIRFIPCTETALYAKWRIGFAAASNDWLTFWADDDWHGPRRLAALRANADADIVGPSAMYYHELEEGGRSFRYVYGGDEPHVIDGLTMFRRSLWEQHPIGTQIKSAAGWWLLDRTRASASLRVIPQGDYVAFIHGDNITARKPRVSRHGEVLSDSYMTLLPPGALDDVLPSSVLAQFLAARYAQSGEQE